MYNFKANSRPRGLFGGSIADDPEREDRFSLLARIGQRFEPDEPETKAPSRSRAGLIGGLGQRIFGEDNRFFGTGEDGSTMADRMMMTGMALQGDSRGAAAYGADLQEQRQEQTETETTARQRGEAVRQAIQLVQNYAPENRALMNAAMSNPDGVVEMFLGNMEAGNVSAGASRFDPATNQMVTAPEMFSQNGTFGTQTPDGVRFTGQDDLVREGMVADVQNTRSQINDRAADNARADAEGQGAQWEEINSFRSEAEGALGDFRDIEASYQRVIDSVAEPSAAGDLALIFNYMKMLDPGSAVRETEFANAQNAGGIPDRIRAQYNAIKRGERLSEPQRSDFYSRAQRLYGGQRTLADERLSQFEEQAQTRGLPSQYAIPRLSDFSERAPQQATGDGPREGQTATNPQTNERVVYRNGEWQPLMSAAQR